MLKVEVNEKQPLERALKVLKKKWDKTKTLRELRERKNFVKKSVKRREEIKKAEYVQKKYGTTD
jgi:small subunit ribosomal protein S21